MTGFICNKCGALDHASDQHDCCAFRIKNYWELKAKLAIAVEALTFIEMFDVKTGGNYVGTAKVMCDEAREALKLIGEEKK